MLLALAGFSQRLPTTAEGWLGILISLADGHPLCARPTSQLTPAIRRVLFPAAAPDSLYRRPFLEYMPQETCEYV